ncbi:MAG: hypothetical protein JL50_01110 [Peptococcaceae bacterium BICA1-7]|nr:MAG: hypothetical protein JL50_01110 [Peptococcaceae bacterium BICA1-7]HBV98012.1 DUF192 domain-containing protein [Desulfotomaculum sp.]
MKLINCSNGKVISSHVVMADRFITRLTGLMGKKEMPSGSALILKPCSQAHTFFMRFNIDILFLSLDFRVKHVVQNMRPWRISRLVWGARCVVELPGGTLRNRVLPGDTLKLEE